MLLFYFINKNLHKLKLTNIKNDITLDVEHKYSNLDFFLMRDPYL